MKKETFIYLDGTARVLSYNEQDVYSLTVLGHTDYYITIDNVVFGYYGGNWMEEDKSDIVSEAISHIQQLANDIDVWFDKQTVNHKKLCDVVNIINDARNDAEYGCN